MAQSPIATAADYADAMLIARRVRGLLVLLLLVMLALQIALFFMVRTDVIHVQQEQAAQPASTQPTTEPALVLATGEGTSPRVLLMLQYLVGLIDFLGVIGALLLTCMLLLLVQIMLVGRLIGLSHVMAALIGSMVVVLLLFPWQAFLDNAGLTAAQADFKVPGVLYTWDELVVRSHFLNEWSLNAFLKWARFVGFPVLAFVLVLWVQIRSSRGLRLALGEVEPSTDEFAEPQA